MNTLKNLKKTNILEPNISKTSYSVHDYFTWSVHALFMPSRAFAFRERLSHDVDNPTNRLNTKHITSYNSLGIFGPRFRTLDMSSRFWGGFVAQNPNLRSTFQDVGVQGSKLRVCFDFICVA